MITNYKELKVWKMGFAITMDFYKILSSLPEKEKHNIDDQMRRAATSIPLNIAEGASSRTDNQFINHLHYAYASAQEIEVLLMLCLKLEYVDQDLFRKISDNLDAFSRALYRFTKHFEDKNLRDKNRFIDSL